MLLGVGACGVVDPADPPGIAGRYDLVAVNDSALPCCTLTDSSGTVVAFAGGSLTLADAAAEPFVATPAGWMPKSCVFEIPNGGRVDTSGVVTLPDSSQYRIPKCTELHHAAYSMIVTRRYALADGGSRTASDTSAGVYAWTNQNDNALVSLLNADILGRVVTVPSGVQITGGRENLGRGPALTPSDPAYQFFRSTSEGP